MKFRLFEFEDLPWFPDVIRSGGTDYLRYFLTATDFYEPVTPLLIEGLQKTGSTELLDLCSGAGGSVLQIQKNLEKELGHPVHITLSDKFPNAAAFEFLASRSKGSMQYETESTDALRVPQTLSGFRTIFSGFHHFDKPAAVQVLQDAVDARKGIAIFDGGDKNLLVILGILIFHPLAFILFTPFFKPFRLSRLFFTYIIPVIPIYTVWDGMVSVTRLHSPDQLMAFSRETSGHDYVWKTGKVNNKWGMRVSYLIGYPG